MIGDVITNAMSPIRAYSANRYERTDDEDVGAVEAHGAVLLDDRQGHEAHVCGLGPEGRQLLAQDVPLRGNVETGKGLFTTEVWTKDIQQEIMPRVSADVLVFSAPSASNEL
jgi:hypothetical protein